MADERKRGGFFSRLFGTDNLERGDPPDIDDALPERASDPDLPDPADNNERDDVESVREIEATVRGGPDADMHGPASATPIEDEEAGALADEPETGRITPLAEMAARAAQKKTPG